MLLSIPEYSPVCSLICQHLIQFAWVFEIFESILAQTWVSLQIVQTNQTPFATTSLKSVKTSWLPFGASARMSGMLFFSLVYVSSRLKYWSSLMICSRHLVLSKLLCSPPYSDGRILLGMCRWSDLRSLPCVRICWENKDDSLNSIASNESWMGAYAIPNFLFQKWFQQRQYCIKVERLMDYVERLEAHRKGLLDHFDRAPGQIRGQKLGMRKPNASHVQQDNDAANLTARITDCILQC